MKLTDIVQIVEDVVRVHSYYVFGVVSGDKIALVSNRDGSSKIWLYSLRDGELEKASWHIVASVAEPPRGADRIVYTRDVAGGAEKHEIRVVYIDNLEDSLLVDQEPARIFGIADNGKSIAYTRSTGDEISVYLFDNSRPEKIAVLPGMGFVTSMDDRYIVGFGSLKGNPRSAELFIIDTSTGDFRIYTPKDGSYNSMPKVQSGKVVFETTAYGGNKLALLDLEDMESRELEGEKDYREFRPVEHSVFKFSEDRGFLVVGKKEGRSRVFLNWEEVPTPRGTIYGVVDYKGRVYATVTSFTKPPYVVEAEPRRGYRILIEPTLSDSLKEKLSSEIEFTYINSTGGVRVPTFIVKSHLAKESKSTAVYIHGGPWSEVSDEWRPLMAAIIASGFNLVAPNFRGSTGYGEEYRAMDIGDPGGGDLDDVVAATKYVVEQGIADKDRLYIIGYSYGGYMTLWTLVNRPGMFKCGVAGAAVSDWEEMYELSDAIFKSFIDVLFAKKKELLRERSPINRIENLSDKLCIIHPQNDSRTPLKPILKFMNRLLELGKTYEAHIAPDMGHIVNTIDDAVKILLPALLFLVRCDNRLE